MCVNKIDLSENRHGLFLSHSDLSTKSNVLKFLQKKLKKSKIEKILDFTVSDWQINKKNISFKITNFFQNSKIIIRSSAHGEDSIDQSQAGNYLSILNINSSSKSTVTKAINKVIESYIVKGNTNRDNQILVQNHVSDILTSGVIFTRIPDTDAPYYLINFDDSTFTDSVTKGQVGNTIKIFRRTESTKIPKKWKKLLIAVKEIQDILKSDLLDIEFGITKNEIIIFQVRPITSIKNIITETDIKIENNISLNKNLFQKSSSNHLFGISIYSDMSDWNPSEIIGNNPNPLDYSLYDYLIMKKIWHKGRQILGYQNIHHAPLMKKFGNKPYVDVKTSLNSFLPKEFSDTIKEKLIKFYIKKLIQNPHLHDKIEFEILFTCYDFQLSNRLKELNLFGFTKSEINQIKLGLQIFTTNIINKFPNILDDCKNSILTLTTNRKSILKNIEKEKIDHILLLTAAECLLTNCLVGTLKFSIMARIAFIATILLQSLNNCNKISKTFFDSFMNSIETPLSEIQDDLEKLINKSMSSQDFLEKYGHLRPGTYDITAIRYDNEPDFFENIKFLKSRKKFNKFKFPNDISKFLKENGLEFSNEEFFTFIKLAIKYREIIKFEYTKNLSDALELITKAGAQLGFSKNEIANLDIDTILKNKNNINIKKIWKQKIKKNLKYRKQNNLLVLPPLIFSVDDFDIVKHYVSKPNYITQNSISRDVIALKNFHDQYSEIENKIILIENADPGYDWIFTKNPSGLITKYGGAASHMAIRCAELGLPAAIGCGEILYDQLNNALKIMLDCKNQQIIVLEKEKEDEFSEEKKILKSLGYIR